MYLASTDIIHTDFNKFLLVNNQAHNILDILVHVGKTIERPNSSYHCFPNCLSDPITLSSTTNLGIIIRIQMPTSLLGRQISNVYTPSSTLKSKTKEKYNVYGSLARIAAWDESLDVGISTS